MLSPSGDEARSGIPRTRAARVPRSAPAAPAEHRRVGAWPLRASGRDAPAYARRRIAAYAPTAPSTPRAARASVGKYGMAVTVHVSDGADSPPAETAVTR